MKKIVSAVLCVLMLAGSLGVSSFALRTNTSSPKMYYSDDYTIGDTNGDGAVNAVDTFQLRKYHAKITDEINYNGADVNCDGRHNSKDVLYLKKLMLGLVSESELYESDEAVDRFLIGGNDISSFCIVYDSGAKYVENMYLAADTLRKYVNLATGINLKVSTSSTNSHKIHFVDVTKIEGLEEELYIENYKYEVKNGDLYIYGTRRGNLYAVWEILEDYLGYRFYIETDTYQHLQRFVEIPEGTEKVVRPGIVFRQARQTSNSDAMLQKYPRRLNSSQAGISNDMAYGTATGPHFINAHSYGYYWKMATGQVDVIYNGSNKNDYAAKYEAGVTQNESAWNPCFTDDEVYETLFRGLLETMRYCSGWNTFREETSYMSFSICDNRSVCSCSGCQYIMKDGYQGREPNKKQCLNAGEAGLNLYIANRAARDIREYYEGRPASTYAEGYDSYDELAGYGEPIYDEYPYMKIYSIFYDHTMPNENILTDPRYADLVPEHNLTIVWCGNPCNNHYMGANECNGQVNILKQSGEASAESLKKWGEVFKATGAQVWYWYYPVNYNTYMTDSPNILNIYFDCVYMVSECNVNGIFYEGGGVLYNFERLKEHLAVVFMWSVQYDEDGNLTYMSYDEWTENMKEYLMIYYGAGYEYIYEYILMHDEAGNQSGNCYINNCDYPGDMFDYEYTRDNYNKMRELLVTAMDMAERQAQKDRIEHLLVSCDFLGLSACYKSWYENGTAETKALYVERYDYMYNYVKDNNLRIGSSWSVDDVEYDLTCTPMVSFYGSGTWRSELDDQWVWSGSVPSWGYA